MFPAPEVTWSCAGGRAAGQQGSRVSPGLSNDAVMLEEKLHAAVFSATLL